MIITETNGNTTSTVPGAVSTKTNLGTNYTQNVPSKLGSNDAKNDTLSSYKAGLKVVQNYLLTQPLFNPYENFGASGYVAGPGGASPYGASGYGYTVPNWVSQMPVVQQPKLSVYNNTTPNPFGLQATSFGASGFSYAPKPAEQNNVPAGFGSPSFGASGYSYAANPQVNTNTLNYNYATPASAFKSTNVNKPKAPRQTHHPDFPSITVPTAPVAPPPPTDPFGSGYGGWGGSSYGGWGGGGGGGWGGYGWEQNLINWNVR